MIFTILGLALQTPEQLLNEVKEAYSHVTTAKLKVNFDAMDPVGRKFHGTANIMLLRPVSLRAMVKGTGATQAVYCDGKTVTSLRKNGRVSTAFSWKSLSEALPLNLETLCFLDYSHELSTGSEGGMSGSALEVSQSIWEGKTWTTLIERNKANNASDVYYIGKDDHLIWRVVDRTYDESETYSDTKVEMMRLGEPVPESVFEVPKKT